MKTVVVGVRLAPEVARTYAEFAELMGVPVATAMRETLTENEPQVRELVEMIRKAKAGDPGGLLSSLRSLAETHAQAAAEAIGAVAEAQNERKAKAKKGVGV